MSRKKLTPAQIRERFTAQGAAIAAMVEFAKDQWSGYKPTKKQTEEVNHYIEVLHGDSLKYARTPEDVYFWREVVTHNVASDCNDYLEEEEWQKAQDALSKITKDPKYYVPEQ
ncbi:MAG: hypothetical protein Q4F50_15045 [Bacteroides sp.]|uniref:hypothetical protein n=1 Tax=Bacteroides TaxID=816 RepID=UPI001D0698D3|nr:MULTISPECIES: hypothetical protein [Bacteroides]MCB6594554.1 hypothetical protein [Bacteroides cellulosilyticus]MDO5421358.1 hypothetical protein [Bacteroides sp.]